MGSVGKYRVVRGIFTVVGVRDSEYCVVLVLMPIGNIIVLKSVGER